MTVDKLTPEERELKLQAEDDTMIDMNEDGGDEDVEDSGPIEAPIIGATTTNQDDSAEGGAGVRISRWDSVRIELFR